jgi:hypothetical protein
MISRHKVDPLLFYMLFTYNLINEDVGNIISHTYFCSTMNVNRKLI